jgi:hypothetical protein
MKRTGLVSLLLVVAAFVAVVNTTGQEGSNAGDKSAAGQWEYLVVASPSSTNFSPTGNPRMRKDATGTFGREAFVLEQHMDKLGASGWELVSVAGTPSDPHYYFKRRK